MRRRIIVAVTGLVFILSAGCGSGEPGMTRGHCHQCELQKAANRTTPSQSAPSPGATNAVETSHEPH